MLLTSEGVYDLTVYKNDGIQTMGIVISFANVVLLLKICLSIFAGVL